MAEMNFNNVTGQQTAPQQTTTPDVSQQPAQPATKGKPNQMLIDIEKNIESKVSKENKARYDKTVLAAETMMFDPSTHANMELVKNPESRNDPVNTISKGVAGLMWLLYQQSKRSLPAEVMIYAGTVTICKALDFANRGLGIPLDATIIAQTVQKTSERLFDKMGVTPEMLKQAIMDGKKEINDYQQHQQYLGNKMQAVKGGK